MSVNYNPKIRQSGLTLVADAANRKSYPGSGTNVQDLSSYNLDGTIGGTGVTYVSTDALGCIDFDGSVNQYIDFGNSATLQSLTGTACIWYKQTASLSSYRSLVTKPGLWGIFTSSNILVFYDWGGGERSSGINIADSKWHYVCLSFVNLNVGDPAASLYLDGKLVLSAQLSISANLDTVQVNASSNTATQNNTGRFGHLAIYNVKLSGADILDNYNTMKTRFQQ